MGRLIQWAVAPMLKPFRRLNLQFMGLDWTVMVAMIALNIGTRIPIHPAFASLIMKNDKQIMQHFAKEEREFVEKIMDMCQQVEDTYSYRLTHFLHP